MLIYKMVKAMEYKICVHVPRDNPDMTILKVSKRGRRYGRVLLIVRIDVKDNDDNSANCFNHYTQQCDTIFHPRTT